MTGPLKTKKLLLAELEKANRRIRELEAEDARRKRNEEAREKRLVALTRPLDDQGAVSFEEMFDLDDIQRLQDEFSQATGVASIITHPDGTPLTAPSNFCRLCNDIIRKTEKGLACCFKSDALIGRHSATGPTVERCKSGGLWEAGAGICVGGRHIANWLIGQVRDESQTEEQIRVYAREIGADEEEMAAAFREVPSMSGERFRMVAQMLYTLANQLSAMAFQNVQQARFISQRDRAEAALKETEKSYRDLIEHAPIGIFRSTPRGRYLMANNRLAEMYGYDSARDLLKTVRDIGTEVYADRNDRAKLQSEIERGAVDGVEVRRRRKDGSPLWVSMSMRAVRDKAGNILYYEGFSSDITGRKAAEAALQESESRVRVLVENAPDAIFIQTEGRFAFVNQAAVRLFGAERAEDLLGTPLLDRIHPDFRAVVRERIRRANEEGIQSPVMEERYLRMDGSAVEVEVSPVPFLFEGNPGSLVFVRDITQRKLAEEAMIHNEKMMTVGGLAAGMAHEINNPLGGILQSLQNIKRRLSPELAANELTARESGCSLSAVRDYLQARDVFGFLDAIEDSGKRAARIVSNMLDFSRKGASARAAVDVNDLLEKSISLCGIDYDPVKCGVLNVRVERDYTEGLPRITCIPTQIEQVFVNLLHNAAQALENRKKDDGPPRIVVRTRAQADSVCIEVEDNGPGMEPAVLKRVFDPFFTTKPVGKGTGLGLSVSYFIVTNNHGGSIEAQSSPGRGAKFIVRLPVRPVSEAAPR